MIYLGFWFGFGVPRHLIQHESTDINKFGKQTRWFAINSHHPQDMTKIDRGISQRTLWYHRIGIRKWIVIKSHQRMGRLFGSSNSWMSVQFQGFLSGVHHFWTSQWVWFLSKKIGAKKNMLFKIGWLKNVETLSSYHISFTTPQSQRESRVLSPEVKLPQSEAIMEAWDVPILDSYHPLKCWFRSWLIKLFV